MDNDKEPTRNFKKLYKNDLVLSLKQNANTSRECSLSLPTSHVINYQIEQPVPEISSTRNNNQICTIIDSIKTLITINNNMTQLPNAKLNMSTKHRAQFS
ncbi:35608_t:CDS:1 [Gigaspora margarita]|uniref:35608_t:CDS:1 n=1 Tax=Gigaspora margarita TaxID=4874 RepID=A0ABN7VU79_GIGMA|nr:35608_t:CDS:1 [Gigaspora margarita]